MGSEVLFPLPAPIEEEQRARDKHKKILEDGNTKKIEKVKNSFYTRANSDRRSEQQIDNCKMKLKQQLGDDLKTATEKCCACDDFAKEGVLWYKRGGCGIWMLRVRSEWHSLYGY